MMCPATPERLVINYLTLGFGLFPFRSPLLREWYEVYYNRRPMTCAMRNSYNNFTVFFFSSSY